MKEELVAILADLKNLTPVTQVLSLVERLEAVVAGLGETPAETPVEPVKETASVSEVSPVVTEPVVETPVVTPEATQTEQPAA